MSDLFGVSINELIAGERLNEEGFKESAEENLKQSLIEIEKSSRAFEVRMFRVLVVTTLAATLAIILMPFPADMIVTDKLRSVAVILIIILNAGIANAVNLVAVALNRKNKR